MLLTMKSKKAYAIIAFLLIFSLIFSACSNQGEQTKNGADDGKSAEETAANNPIPDATNAILQFNPPKLEDAPEGPLGDYIRWGYDMIQNTQETLPEYVGNKLSCASCHADGGLNISASPLVGSTTANPQYRPREGTVISMEDRINECFKRSMNGKPLDTNSEEMKAMISYLSYISTDMPVYGDIPWRGKSPMKIEGITPNIEEGEKVYTQSCLACHAADGSGNGPLTGPALWGENSFNGGAGLARLSMLAGYTQKNMPKGAMGGIAQGELTDQQAVDVAAYILSQARTLYEDYDKDFPSGGMPKDWFYHPDHEHPDNPASNK